MLGPYTVQSFKWVIHQHREASADAATEQRSSHLFIVCTYKGFRWKQQVDQYWGWRRTGGHVEGAERSNTGTGSQPLWSFWFPVIHSLLFLFSDMVRWSWSWVHVVTPAANWWFIVLLHNNTRACSSFQGGFSHENADWKIKQDVYNQVNALAWLTHNIYILKQVNSTIFLSYSLMHSLISSCLIISSTCLNPGNSKHKNVSFVNSFRFSLSFIQYAHKCRYCKIKRQEWKYYAH